MAMVKFSKMVCIVVAFCGVAAMASSAPVTFRTLYTFCHLKNCADGFEPLVGLVQGADGNLYG